MSEKPPTSPNTPDNNPPSNPPSNPEIGPISAPGSDRIEKTFGDHRIMAKVGIAYKSFWVDRHEKKAADIKAKMDGLDMSMAALDQASQSLTEVIDNLKRQHIPGSEALQLKLKVIEKQKAELQKGKDKAQTKFEARDNKVKTFTNGRDGILNELIDHYEEKLRPLESGLDKLQHNRDHIEMEFSALNIRNQEMLDSIKKIEEQKAKMEDGLRLSGMSDMAIRNFAGIKTLESMMASRRTNMHTEKERLIKRRSDIEKKIAKADKKANPYRDKRAEFVRAKQGRPIDMGVETRSKEKDDVTTHEGISTKTRQERPESETKPQNNQSGANETENIETNEVNEKPQDILSHVSGWNDYLNDKYGKDNSPISVNMRNFSAETGLTPRNTASINDFGDVLVKYYKYNKIPAGSFEKDVEDYVNNYASK